MAKIPTKWTPPAGIGYTVPQIAINLVTNLGEPIVTNLGENIIPNPYYVIGKIATAWSQI